MNNKRDIFYGIIAVATLIVALLGATLAYFSISVKSNEGAINATAVVISVDYKDGQNVIAQAAELIPATLEVVKDVYEHNLDALNAQANDLDPESIRTNLCRDSNNGEVCSVYRFSIANNITDSPLLSKGILQTEYNGFTYLSYALRNVTSGTWVQLDALTHAESKKLQPCDNNASEAANRCYSVNPLTNEKTYTPIAKNSIFGYNENSEYVTNNLTNQIQEYDLILFIEENGQNQNIDQGKNYSGTIVIDVIDNVYNHITGKNNW